MLTKISLIVALCSHTSTDTIQSKMKELQTANPSSTISLRLDKKATCDAEGNVLVKVKGKKHAN